MPSALVLDINETLLDLSALDPLFEELFGDPAARRDWFARVLMSALTLTATGAYRRFDAVGASALAVTGRDFGRQPDDDDRARIGAAMRALPPHPEVPAALATLREAGHRLVALSNSPPDVLADQLDHAGLRDQFHAVLSVDAAGALKPDPVVYRHAAATLGETAESLMMIAAHGWDLAGAASVGMGTAFVARPGQYPDPSFATPGITGSDMADLASQIPPRTQ